MKKFIREKKVFCGKDYLEVDIFPYTEIQTKASKGKRSKKELVSAPKQMNLNDKNARRYLTQLVNSNFTKNDLHVTLTYCDKYLPGNIKDAEKEVSNYLRRVSYKRKKLGLPPLKYVLVTEYKTATKEDEKPTRIHHHIIMNGGIDRDDVEDLWRKRKRKGQKKGDKIGYANADRLEPNENGLAALCEYLTKNPNGKKRWSSSQNLVKPRSRNNDGKYSRRQIEKLATNPPDSDFWEKKYKGYELPKNEYSYRTEYNETTGWSVYLKLRRKM